MGRYDGEEYAERPPCRPSDHNFAMNGTCWRCGHWRDELIARAKGTLAVLAPGLLRQAEATTTTDQFDGKRVT